MWWEGKTTQITRQNHKCLFSSKSKVVKHDFQIEVDVDLVEELPAWVGPEELAAHAGENLLADHRKARLQSVVHLVGRDQNYKLVHISPTLILPF